MEIKDMKEIKDYINRVAVGSFLSGELYEVNKFFPELGAILRKNGVGMDDMNMGNCGYSKCNDFTGTIINCHEAYKWVEDNWHRYATLSNGFNFKLSKAAHDEGIETCLKINTYPNKRKIRIIETRKGTSNWLGNEVNFKKVTTIKNIEKIYSYGANDYIVGDIYINGIKEVFCVDVEHKGLEYRGLRKLKIN